MPQQKPAYPKNYQQAAVMMAESYDHAALELEGLFTSLRASYDAVGEPVYMLMFRHTPLVSWYPSGLVVLTSGGVQTSGIAHKMTLALDLGRVSCQSDGWLVFHYVDHMERPRSHPFRFTLAITRHDGGLILSADSGAAVWH